jgi:hypothetical protein
VHVEAGTPTEKGCWVEQRNSPLVKIVQPGDPAVARDLRPGRLLVMGWNDVWSAGAMGRLPYRSEDMHEDLMRFTPVWPTGSDMGSYPYARFSRAISAFQMRNKKRSRSGVADIP